MLKKLTALIANMTESPWYARGRFLSRVPDNRGVGATLPTTHIGVMDPENAAAVAALVNAAPYLMAIAEAATLVARACETGGDIMGECEALAGAVDAMENAAINGARGLPS